jgi:hypothetical protein
MSHRRTHHGLKAKLNAGKFEVHQYPNKRGYVAAPSVGSGWKSCIPEGKKK